MKRYELWRSGAAGLADSFFGAGNDSAHRSFESDAQLIWTVEASSWSEAEQKRYDHMGWGRYRTFDRELES